MYLSSFGGEDYHGWSFMTALDHNTGVEVLDLQSDGPFLARELHNRNSELGFAGMQRIARTFIESPEQVLQVLSDVAVDICKADSAGVSIEAITEDGQPVFHWAATSGRFAGFLDAMLPRAWMPCGICLDRNRPQWVRVPAAHFKALGIEDKEIAPITDGMLIPWQSGSTRGTVWILAHERLSAFDSMDYQIMQMFADFAAMATRQQQQQEELIRHAKAASAAFMAHELAHQINNPLQKITNSIFLAATDSSDAKAHITQAASDLHELSKVVQRLLVFSRLPDL